MGEREELSKRKKLGWGGGGGSHSGCNKLFENKEKAVLAVQSHFLAVCVSVNSKPRLLFKERGKKRRGKRGRGGGGGGVSWISTSTSLSMAWSLGLRPGTGAREEGACRRGRE